MGFHHVAITTRDLAATHAFYTDVMGFELVRVDHLITPNEARCLGAMRSTTRYTVFTDNDVLFTPGWLDPLVALAERTGAWITGPITLDDIMAAPITRCDVPQWTFAGISLAGFNAIFSAAAAALVLTLLRRGRTSAA